MMDRDFYFSKEELGRRVAELIKSKGNGYDQSQLAKDCGIDTAQVSRMVNGGREVTLEKLDKVCKALNTTPDYLMYGRSPIELISLAYEEIRSRSGIEITFRIGPKLIDTNKR